MSEIIPVPSGNLRMRRDTQGLTLLLREDHTISKGCHGGYIISRDLVLGHKKKSI